MGARDGDGAERQDFPSSCAELSAGGAAFQVGRIVGGQLSRASSLAVDGAGERLRAVGDRMAARGLRITNRYSPGDCEWHVSEQQELFRLLPAGCCGVTLTDTSLMRPVKSVTGLLGVDPEVRRVPYTCRLRDVDDSLCRKLAKERAGSEARG